MKTLLYQIKKVIYIYIYSNLLFMPAIVDIQAQSFIPGILTEYIYPSSPIPYELMITCHVSNYHYEKVNFHLGDLGHLDEGEVTNDLYVWAWSSINNIPPAQPGCGIAWERTEVGDPTNVIDKGYIMFDKFIYDAEVAFIKVRDSVYVYLAYQESTDYGFPGTWGHKYDIYRWDSGDLTPLYTGLYLSTSIDYGRISIDAHDLRNVAMVWQEPKGLYIKVFDPILDPILGSNKVFIEGTRDGQAPDVAFFQIDDDKLKVRIAYVEPGTGGGFSYDYIVEHQIVGDLFPPVISSTFITDEILPNSIYVPAYGLDGRYLQLDCPDHSPGDRWAITVVDPSFGDVEVKIKYPGSTVSTINVTSGHFLASAGWNIQCAFVAYDANPQKIHVGFHGIQTLPSPSPSVFNFYSASFLEDGTKLVLAGNEFKEIANDPYDPLTVPSLSFSKQNNSSSQLFTSYNAFTRLDDAPIVGEIRHKHAPYGFVEGQFNASVAFPLFKNEIEVYPNPIQIGQSKLKLPKEWKQEDKLTLIITDNMGREYYKKEMEVGVVNDFFQYVMNFLSSGIYNIAVTYDQEQLSTRFVKP